MVATSLATQALLPGTTGRVWMKSVPHLSSHDGPGRDQPQGFGPTRNRKVVGSNPTSGSETARQSVVKLALLVPGQRLCRSVDSGGDQLDPRLSILVGLGSAIRQSRPVPSSDRYSVSTGLLEPTRAANLGSALCSSTSRSAYSQASALPRARPDGRWSAAPGRVTRRRSDLVEVLHVTPKQSR
jgi:hypothetical protein